MAPAWKRLRLVHILLFIPLSIVLDLLAAVQHSFLADGPYLPIDTQGDAAVVLGYALRRDGKPTLPLRQRIEAGVRLYDEERVRYVVFSGGHPGGGIRGQSEAAAMDAYAEFISKTGHTERWLLEDESTSTRENALFSLTYCEEHLWTDIVVVTSPFHQLRSRLVFQCAIKQMFPHNQRPKVSQVWLAKVKMSRAQGSQLLYDPFLKQWNFFRELLALAWYWYQGWLC